MAGRSFSYSIQHTRFNTLGIPPSHHTHAPKPQKNLTPLVQEAKHFFSTYAARSIYRGIGPCIGRETLYAAGYLGLCPVLYDMLREKVGWGWGWGWGWQVVD